MAGHCTVTLTTAPSGTGKTYIRCARFIVDEWLRDAEGGVHISNFPIVWEGLIEAAGNKWGRTEEEVRARVEVIPEEVVNCWIKGESGPWEYFSGRDLTDCHLALDEIHEMCGDTAPLELKTAWAEWLGQLRHTGMTFEAISQHPEKIAAQVKREAELFIQLYSSDLRPDPYFKIFMGDWYELFAKFKGRYDSVVFEEWYVQRDRRKVLERSRRWRFEPGYFKVFNSHSKPRLGGIGASDKKREWERRSWGSLLRWFFFRNAYQLVSRLTLGVAAFWLVFMGGAVRVVPWVVGVVTAAVGGRTAAAQTRAVGSAELQAIIDRPRAVVSPGSVGGRPPASAPSSRPSKEQDELERLRDLVARDDEVVGIVGRAARWRRGFVVRAGEVIPWGKYQGLTVRAVDIGRGCVLLSSGVALPLSRAVRPDRRMP